MSTMRFSDVIDEMHKEISNRVATKRFCRLGWNGKNQWIQVQIPDENSKMTVPYIYIRTVQSNLVPWLASQTDMLAHDWQEV